MFDAELIWVCSFFRTVHIPLQNFTFLRGGCCSAALRPSPRERCEDNLACPPAGPAGVVPLCYDSSACHQVGVNSWLEISVVLVRDVSDSIPALAQGKMKLVKMLLHLPHPVSGWIPRLNRANLGTPQSVTTFHETCPAPSWALHVLSGNLQITPHLDFACFWTQKPQR